MQCVFEEKMARTSQATNRQKKTVESLCSRQAGKQASRQVEANSVVDLLKSGIYVSVNNLPRAYADVMRALAALPRGTE